MDINLDSEETDLELNINLEEEQEIDSNSEDLQRTESWYQQRVGKFTASQIKNLMSCSLKGGKLTWFDREKWLMFSSGTPKFIFKVAMERKKNFSIVTRQDRDMKYGALIEPFIHRRFNEIMLESGLEVCEVGFKDSKTIKNLGASSDGIVLTAQGQEFNYEQKATTSWGGYYDRIYDFEDEKSLDFWQIQSQMVVNDTNETYYVVASPPKDIDVYLRAEDLDSLYNHWVAEVELKINLIKKSEIHCNALIKRVQIADDVVEEFLKLGANINTLFYERIANEIDYNEANTDYNKNVLQDKNVLLQELPHESNVIAQAKIDYNDLPF